MRQMQRPWRIPRLRRKRRWLESARDYGWDEFNNPDKVPCQAEYRGRWTFRLGAKTSEMNFQRQCICATLFQHIWINGYNLQYLEYPWSMQSLLLVKFRFCCTPWNQWCYSFECSNDITAQQPSHTAAWWNLSPMRGSMISYLVLLHGFLTHKIQAWRLLSDGHRYNSSNISFTLCMRLSKHGLNITAVLHTLALVSWSWRANGHMHGASRWLSWQKDSWEDAESTDVALHREYHAWTDLDGSV